MPATVDELLARLGAQGPGLTVEELAHNRWLSPGVWRVQTDAGQRAVLKYTTAARDRGATAWEAHWTAGDDNPRRWTYWRREALAYQEHLVDAYQGSGVRAPACLQAAVDDREALLLLGWGDGQPGELWPVGSYAPAARALGRAQAPYLAGRPIPNVPWLSLGFLRQYSSEKPVEWGLLDDDGTWAHPVARQTFPTGLREDVAFVHANRERLHQVHESLPSTLCHLDFWPKNLVLCPSGEVMLLDWAFVGVGAVGEDIGNLVPDASFDHFIAAHDLPALERVVFDGYLEGLREAGWKDDPRLVQLGMWSSAVKYDWMAPFTLAQLGQSQHRGYGGVGQLEPLFRFRERSRVLQFNARWARQALELADQLGF